jgi:hypothetical protein
VQEGKLTLAVAPRRQNRSWLGATPVRTVLLVDEQGSEFKRSLASNLVVLRLGAGHSQGSLAKALSDAGAVVSEATCRRWEDPDLDHVPDAWQVNRLCELLDCEADELIHPKPLTDREREIAKRAGRAGRRATLRSLPPDGDAPG